MPLRKRDDRLSGDPCCINSADVTVSCDDGDHPFDPGPPTMFCPGHTYHAPCPCPGFLTGISIAGVNCPFGTPVNIRYSPDCCINVTVNVNPSTGCVDIFITAGSCMR